MTLKTNVYAMFWVTKAALPHLQAGLDDHQQHLDPGLQPLAGPAGLRHHQGRDQQLHQGAGPAARAEGHPGQRGRARAGVDAAAVRGGQPPEKLPEFGENTPLGRPAQPAELAPAYVFLASAESSYVVGETLNVNGGNPTP